MDMKIALAGNPNCGKTTLFNDLTGSNQYVGNWPGVTVEKKEGRLKGRKDIVIQDLPGIYSLSPYTLEEVVARNYLVKEKPDAILNIVDGTNIERNLYLTTQLIELGLPVVVAVNMMDLVRRNGDQIDARKLSDALEGWGVNEVGVGLICDGALAGVGAVLGFVPQMLVLFLMLAILEDIGYMARIAFIMDRIFRKFGLSGKSFIPMLVGTGCGVPGVMASRTIENERDRRMTVMTTCFIPCGAKMPIIGLIAGALFGGSGLVAASAYFIGVAAIVISGIILKKTKMFAGDPAPFVMELPAYHIPSVGNVLRATWERGWSFIKRAGTVILASSIILWFLQGFGWENGAFGLVEDMNNSVLAAIGSAVAFIFAPLGFGNWRATVAVVTGLIAKENVVATFGVLYNFAGELSENGDEIWALVAQDYTAISAYSFMIFNLLCAPCFAAMGAIKREMNNAKWTAFAIGYMCVFAYVVSLIVYQIGGLITGEVSFGIGTVVAVVLVVGIVYLLFRKNKYEDERLTIRSVDAAGRRAALK